MKKTHIKTEGENKGVCGKCVICTHVFGTGCETYGG